MGMHRIQLGLSALVALGMLVGSLGPVAAGSAHASELATPQALELNRLLVGERDPALGAQLAALLAAGVLGGELAAPLMNGNSVTPVTNGNGGSTQGPPTTCCTPDQIQAAQNTLRYVESLVLASCFGLIPAPVATILINNLQGSAARTLPPQLYGLITVSLARTVGPLGC
jgi:hypothetical protein